MSENMLDFRTSAYPELRLKDVYEKKLRQRMTIFREVTKSTKALVNTFVTTFGVADGMHKSIVNSEVTLDELFE